MMKIYLFKRTKLLNKLKMKIKNFKNSLKNKRRRNLKEDKRKKCQFQKNFGEMNKNQMKQINF